MKTTLQILLDTHAVEDMVFHVRVADPHIKFSMQIRGATNPTGTVVVPYAIQDIYRNSIRMACLIPGYQPKMFSFLELAVAIEDGTIEVFVKQKAKPRQLSVDKFRAVVAHDADNKTIDRVIVLTANHQIADSACAFHAHKLAGILATCPSWKHEPELPDRNSRKDYLGGYIDDGFFPRAPGEPLSSAE